VDRGNVKIMTVMGEALMEELSDRGSIPLSSIPSIHIRVPYANSLGVVLKEDKN